MAVDNTSQQTGSFYSKVGEKVIGGSRALSAWILFLLSIGLYYYDWLTQFNGLKIEVISANSNLFFKGGMLAVAIILFAYQYLTAKEKSKEDIASMFFLSLVFAFVFVIGQYSAEALLHIVMAIMIWMLLLKGRMSDREANGAMVFILMADLFLFTLIEYAGSYIGPVTSTFIAYRFIFPIYSLYILFYLKSKEESNLAAYCILLLVIFYVAGFIITTDQYRNAVAKVTPEQQEATVSWAKAAGTNVVKGFDSIFDPFRCAQHVGTDYEGCINKLIYERECTSAGLKKGTKEFDDCVNAKKEAGGTASGTKDVEVVHYTKVEFKKMDNYKVDAGQREPIVAEVNVDSKYKSINIKNSCFFKKDNNNISAEVIAGAEFNNIQGVSALEVSCRPQTPYAKGLTYFELDTTVEGMNTRSEKKKVWVQEGSSDAIKKDILSNEGLNDIEDKSKSDDDFAALAISIGPDDSILSNNQKTQLLKAKIQNLKEGAIVRIDEMTIELPDGVVPMDDCNEYLEPYEGGLRVKEDLLARKSENAAQLKLGERLNAFSCNLDVSALTNPTDHVIRTFISYMKYSYKIKEKTSIEAI